MLEGRLSRVSLEKNDDRMGYSKYWDTNIFYLPRRRHCFSTFCIAQTSPYNRVQLHVDPSWNILHSQIHREETTTTTSTG